MARDYAPRSGGSNRRQTRSTGNKKRGGGGGGVPGWVWMIAGLSVGLAVAAIVYIKRPVDTQLMPQVAEREAQETPSSAPAEGRKSAPRKAEKPKQGLELPPKEKERFTFYEILKNQEVVLPREAAKSAQPPATPKPQAPPPNADGTPPPSAAANADANSGSYIIQVASYRSQADAERQKASLALIGIEARIETVTIDNKDTFYRVRIGPEKNWQRVQQTMARLESNGIQALLVKLQ